MPQVGRKKEASRISSLRVELNGLSNLDHATEGGVVREALEVDNEYSTGGSTSMSICRGASLLDGPGSAAGAPSIVHAVQNSISVGFIHGRRVKEGKQTSMSSWSDR